MSIRNNVSLIGNLGSAPNTTITDGGTSITEFSLATNEYFRDRDGNRQTRTMWHRVKAFGKVADILGQYLTSGSQVAIEGRISYNKWIDKHEQVRISTEIIVEDFTFLSSSRQAEEGELSSASSQVVSEPAPKASAKAKGKGRSTKSKATKDTAKTPEAALVEHDELPF